MSSPRMIPDTREEAAAKLPALHVLMAMGWEYLPPTDCLPLRGSEHAVLLEPIVRARLAAHRLEHKGKRCSLSGAAIDQAFRELAKPPLQDGLMAANKRVHQQLTLGITVSDTVDGQRVNTTVPLIDWSDPSANQFHVTEEMSVERPPGHGRYRPDLVCFVNGVPLAVLEAKRPVSSTKPSAMVEEGVSQHLRNQKPDRIEQLYAYSQLLFSISGSEGKYGTTATLGKFWARWREEEIPESAFDKIKATPLKPAQIGALFKDREAWARRDFEKLHEGLVLPTEQDRLLISLLRPDRLLEFIAKFLLFETGGNKLAARYQQVFGVKAMLERVQQRDDKGARTGGVIWHTTGSGKSNLMVFLCKALLQDPALADCRIIVVTDRVDLEKQLAGTFLTGGALGSDVATRREGERLRAGSGAELATRIGAGGERFIFTLLQKFNSATKYKKECHNPSDKLIVLVDEGHRSQGGENHERMRQALPNAAFIAFTGTPLLKDDKTRNKFGPILHAYTMQRAIEDGAVTPLVYEERKPVIDINEAAIDAWFEKITMGLSEQQQADLKRKFGTRGRVYGAENRIELIAYDIAVHFNENFKKLDLGLKAQLATDSKLSAIRYNAALDATGMVTSAIVISPPDDREGHEDIDPANSPAVQQWWNANVGQDPRGYEDRILRQFKEDNEPEILIVVDKLLTGFDEPRNAVLYIDKPLKAHNLLQAIARVNRLHEAKKHGFLVDYRGILAELDTSMKQYQDLAAKTQAGYEIDDLEGTVTNVAMEYKRLPALHDALWAIFAGVENKLDRQQFRRVLAPKLIDDPAGGSQDENQKIREDFYEALTEFGMCLKLALSSRAFFEDRSFDEATIMQYKRDLKFFTELRKQAKQDAQETVDFSAYEAQILRLVDKQVSGREIRSPDGVIIVGPKPESDDPKDWSPEKTRTEADLIKTRVRKTIEQELADDPYAQRTFSELLKKAIEEAEALFDFPGKQYEMFKDLEELVETGATPGVPKDLSEDPQARAFYGAFRLRLDDEKAAEIGDAPLVEQARETASVVEEATQSFSLNPDNAEASIRQKLLPGFSKLFGGVDVAKSVLGVIIDIVRAGQAKRR